MERDKFESLYSNLITKSDIKRRKLRQLKPMDNNIGFMFVVQMVILKNLYGLLHHWM